jgi:hypothetical protein
VDLSDFDRLQGLVNKWTEHMAEAHPDVHMDDARYDRNLASSYIMCCQRGCKWSYSLTLDHLTA